MLLGSLWLAVGLMPIAGPAQAKVVQLGALGPKQPPAAQREVDCLVGSTQHPLQGARETTLFKLHLQAACPMQARRV